MWIFGYGSLIWKTDFPFNRKLTGHINGYLRRFWQGSEDHRGVPGKPGRVVTLVKSNDPADIVWGVAYEIAKEEAQKVKEHLDRREKGGYEIEQSLFTPISNNEQPFNVEIYIGSMSNPFFLGPAEEDEIAMQISLSNGKSGSNAEYLFQLATAMKDIAPHVKDSHLYSLEYKVKAILNPRNVQGKENHGEKNDSTNISE